MRPRSSVGRMGVGRWLVLTVLLWGAGLPTASAAELANRFAPGALGYAETASLGDIVERFQQSNYWTAVTQSPQWKQATATPEFRKALAARDLVERQLGMDLPTAVTRLLGNRVAVAVYPVLGTQPDFVVLVEAKDDAVLPEIRRRLDPLLVLGEEQLRLSQGLDGWEHLSIDNKLFVAWKGRWLVAAGKHERLEEAVARVSGQNADTLAAEPNFQAMLRSVGGSETPGERPLLVYVDSDRLQKLIGKGGLPEKLDNPLGSLLFGDAVARAGRSKFAALTVDLQERGARARLTLGGESAGLAEAFQAFYPKQDEHGVEPLPATEKRIGGWTIYRDFAGWYANRAHLMQDQVLPGFDKFESGLANLLPNRDFGEDVLPLFGKRLTFVSAPQTFEHLGSEPGVKLPGFALVIEMAQPEEATTLLQLFFQTLTAILNLEAGQQGRQPWVVATEMYRDVPISYAKYLKKPTGDRLGVVFNFLPAAARVGDRFVFSSSLGLCKQLIDDLQNPAAPAPASPRTIQADVRLDPLADVLEANREFFVGRMVQEGRTTAVAEEEFKTLLSLLRQLESVQLYTEALPEAYRVELGGTWK